MWLYCTINPSICTSIWFISTWIKMGFRGLAVLHFFLGDLVASRDIFPWVLAGLRRWTAGGRKTWCLGLGRFHELHESLLEHWRPSTDLMGFDEHHSSWSFRCPSLLNSLHLLGISEKGSKLPKVATKDVGRTWDGWMWCGEGLSKCSGPNAPRTPKATGRPKAWQGSSLGRDPRQLQGSAVHVFWPPPSGKMDRKCCSDNQPVQFQKLVMYDIIWIWQYLHK